MRFSDWLILVVGGVLAGVMLVAVCWAADWLVKMLLAVFA